MRFKVLVHRWVSGLDGSAAPHVEYRVRRPDTGEVRWLSRTIPT